MSSRSDVLKVGNVTYTYYPVNRVNAWLKRGFLVKSEAKSNSVLRAFFSRISLVYLSSLILR